MTSEKALKTRCAPLKWLKRMWGRTAPSKACTANKPMTLRVNHHGNVNAIHAAVALRKLGAVVNVRQTDEGRVLVVEGMG